MKFIFNPLIILLFISFFITSNTFDYEQSIANGFTDVKTYYDIASDGFDEKNGLSGNLHRLERWPIHIIVHLISKSFDLDIWTIYRILIIILSFICCIIINTLSISQNKKILIWNLILFNPYTFRLYYLTPGMVSDCLFFVGTLLFVCGLLNNNHYQINSALFISIISKQTALLFFPIMIILYLNRMLTFNKLCVYLLFIISSFITIKILTVHLFSTTNKDYFIHHLSGMVIWLINDFSFESGFAFFGRYIFFLLTLFGLIVLFNKNYKYNWLFISFFFLYSVQPLLGGPSLTGGNILRLCSLGIPFLIPVIIGSELNNNKMYYFIIISFLNSFHHLSSILYYVNNARFYFFSIVLIVAISSLIIKSNNIKSSVLKIYNIAKNNNYN